MRSKSPTSSNRRQRPSARRASPRKMPRGLSEEYKDPPKVGDAERALADADVMLDAEYETPTQHHNPIELFSTTCVWSDDN